MSESREQFQERVAKTCFMEVERWANNAIAHETWESLGTWKKAAYFNAAKAVYAAALRDVCQMFQEQIAGHDIDGKRLREFIGFYAAERGIDLGETP